MIAIGLLVIGAAWLLLLLPLVVMMMLLVTAEADQLEARIRGPP